MCNDRFLKLRKNIRIHEVLDWSLYLQNPHFSYEWYADLDLLQNYFYYNFPHFAFNA